MKKRVLVRLIAGAHRTRSPIKAHSADVAISRQWHEYSLPTEPTSLSDSAKPDVVIACATRDSQASPAYKVCRLQRSGEAVLVALRADSYSDRTLAI